MNLVPRRSFSARLCLSFFPSAMRGALTKLTVVCLMGMPAAAQSAHFLGETTTLATFSSGSFPVAVAVDSEGNVYAADYGDSKAYKVPFSGGSYGTPTQLGSGFNMPQGIAVDSAGNVYVSDTGNKVVKKVPNSGGTYGTPVTLGSFDNPKGIAVDGLGNIYVADLGALEVRKIPYSGGSYGAPVSLGGFAPEGVAVDAAGNVYVADAGLNAVKKIPYSGGSYGTPVTLGSGFSFPDGVAVDGAGNVYVGDTGNNAVKEIPYSGGSYGTPLTLGSGFNFPSGIVLDAAGSLYVADEDNNAIKKIELTVNFGTANVGVAASSQTFTFSIDSTGTLGTPFVLTQGATNKDFTDAGTGTCTTNGTSNTYNANDTCTVVVNFTPATPGTRYGAVQLVSNSAAPLAVAYLSGTGTGAQVTFPAGSMATLGGSFSSPDGVAVDGAGNVYVADYDEDTVQKIPYNNGNYGTPVTLASGFGRATGVAVDGAGNVYVADYGYGVVQEILYSSGSYGTPVTIGSGLDAPFGVAVDGGGNVYVACVYDDTVHKIPYSSGSYGTPVTLGSGFSSPFTVAVDGAGNVYVADQGNSAIKEIPYSGGNYGTPVTLGSGFFVPDGVAVDGSGNVYVADTGNSAIKAIPYSGGSYGTPVTLGSGFRFPGDVAVDSNGNVYVADAGNGSVKKIDLADAPSLSFAATATGSTSSDSPQTVTVANTGNTSLSFPAPIVSGVQNPSIALNFTLSSPSIGGCPLLYSSSSAGTLAAGASCTYHLNFAPLSAGTITGQGNITDNNNAAGPSYVTQTISLSGTASKGTPVVTTSSASLSYGTANTTLSATVSYGGAAPTGAVTFAVGSGSSITATCTGSSSPLTCTAGYSTAALNVSNSPYAITTSIAEDTNYNTASGINSLTVTAILPALSWTPASSTITYGATLNGLLNAAASYNSSPVSGAFAYLATPSGGGASVSVTNSTILAAGSYTLSTQFTPTDATDYTAPPASSQPLTVNKATAPVTLGSLSQTYTGSPLSVTATTNPSGLAVTFTYNGNSAPPTTTGSYTVAATINDSNYQGSATDTLVIGKATAQVTLGSLSQTYTGSPLSATATTNPSGLAVAFTYNSSPTPPTTGGSYTVAATINDTNYQGSATGTLVIGKANAQVMLSNLSQTYTGSPLSATATTNPSGLAVAFTYNSSPTPPTTSGSYAVAATINDTNYQGSAPGTLVIGKAMPAVNWNTPTAITYGTTLTSAQLNASSGTAGSFSYSPVAGTVLQRGNQTLTVQFTPTDGTDYLNASASVPITVNAATLTLVANDATRVYGVANPTLTGSVDGQQNSDGFVESFSTTAAISSPVGTYAIMPSVSGANLADYTQSATNGTLTITKAASTTALTPSSSSITPDRSITLFAQVSSVTTGTPTGMVSFYDGSTLLGSVQLVSGQASFATSTLAPGATHSLSVSYAGDSNFNASNTASSASVTVAPLDFSITLSGSNYASLLPGQSIAYQMSITPDYGAYAGTVNFSISGLPAGATATFSPASIAANGGPQTITVTIQAASSTAAHQAPGAGGGFYTAATGMFFLGLGLFRRRARALPRMLAMFLLVMAGTAATSALTGCGSTTGFFGTSPQSYTVTITGVSGSLTHSTSVTLNVQ